LTPYPYTKGGELYYKFTTDQGLLYTAVFFDYGYLFAAYPEYVDDIYSFTLDAIKGEISTSGLDEKIGETVVSIFRDFFRSKQNVVIYVCDSLDDKHLARKRKFDLWFWKYNDGTILKEDGLAVIAGMEIYNSLLVNKQHPHAEGIIKAFRTLNERVDDK